MIRQLDRDLAGRRRSTRSTRRRPPRQPPPRRGHRRRPGRRGHGHHARRAAVGRREVRLAHIGDSRAYRLRDGQLQPDQRPTTRFVQSLVDEGRISRAEGAAYAPAPLADPARAAGRDDNEPDLTLDRSPRVGDRYLLCSDGLSDMVDDDAIAAALRTAPRRSTSPPTELVRLRTRGRRRRQRHRRHRRVRRRRDARPTEHLSCADGQPQLVGAAAEPGPSRRTGTTSTSLDAIPLSPDEVGADGERGAVTRDSIPRSCATRPAPPRRRRWLRWRWSSSLIVVGSSRPPAQLTYDWTQRQYYVGTEDGRSS